MSSMSDAFFLIRLHISIVNTVELLLNIEVKDDMSADIITASIKPTYDKIGCKEVSPHRDNVDRELEDILL